jgi:hypothetical protein
MIVLAIDPGAKGALAFFDPKAGTLEIVDTPTVEVKRGTRRLEQCRGKVSQACSNLVGVSG